MQKQLKRYSNKISNEVQGLPMPQKRKSQLYEVNDDIAQTTRLTQEESL